MAGVVKATVARVSGSVGIDNTVRLKPVEIPVEISAKDTPDTDISAEAEKDEQEQLREQEAQHTKEEVEKLMRYYTEEGEKALALAKEKAAEIIAKTEKDAEQYAEQAKQQAEELFEKARNDGYEKGQEDGYKKGLAMCADMLRELKELSENLIAGKGELYESYEADIFDAVMEISNRITVGCVSQKDKVALRKMIKEAGKSFRGSEYVRLTLSKTDITEEMAADSDYFKKLFTNVKTVEVEFLKDAPSGTIIIDNESETVDAGVSTQLKMIEELGRGKYRNAPSRRKKAQPKPEEDEEE